MAVTYPLSLPLSPNAYTLEALSVNLVTQSPFTLQQQVMQGIGEGWALSLTFPPITTNTRSAAVKAFLTSLRGQLGTFQWGPPVKELNYTTSGGTLTLASINNTLRNNITYTKVGGESVPETGTYIQIGTQLLQVLKNDGNNNIDIFPALRTNVAAGTTINFTTPKGVFRLKSASSAYTFNIDHTRTFSLEAIEAI